MANIVRFYVVTALVCSEGGAESNAMTRSNATLLDQTAFHCNKSLQTKKNGL